MNQTQSNFLINAVPAAIATQRAWGVPASVTIAQAILESGWGTSALTKQANNYFGIKAASTANPETYEEFRTTEVVDGRSVKEMAAFARYPSPQASFEAHAQLLRMAKRYQPAMAAKADPVKFAMQLESCGYSTSPTYASQLVTLMMDYDLMQYDIPAQQATSPTPAAAPAKE